MKTALILGGGGFIGGHISKKLKDDGFWVRVVDIRKSHPFWNHSDICDEYVCGDLKDSNIVQSVIDRPYDEVYQLAADMGGAGFISSGENDADVMYNSALINLNVAKFSQKAGVKRVFYSSSACVYPEHNQLDPLNPNCKEDSVYPANPDSEYGWEKLFSERMFLSFNKNYNLDVRIGRYHNIFGTKETWEGGREKVPAAICRKVAETPNGGEIEIWGDGLQTRSFLYIDDCVEATIRFMRQDSFKGPVNIGSEEMISINELANMVIGFSGKDIKIKNIEGDEFYQKYGFQCPLGVRGRNSDNTLYKEKMNWEGSTSLIDGMKITFDWITEQVNGR